MSGTSIRTGLVEFTDKFDTSLLVKSLSNGLRGRYAVAEVRGSNNQLAKEFGLGAQPQYPIYLALCAENGKLAGLKYSGPSTRANIERWLDKNFLGEKRVKTCKKLRNAEAMETARRYKLSMSAMSMSEAQLQGMRVKQLREVAEDLNIKTEVLREKRDFIEAILEMSSNTQAREARDERLRRTTEKILKDTRRTRNGEL